MALREFLRTLEEQGELRRTQVELDPALELTEVASRGLREGKPALLLERPARSSFPMALNHFASPRRIEIALGEHPEKIGEELIRFLESVFPPTFRALMDNRSSLKRLYRSRPANVAGGYSQEIVRQPDLDQLPVQTCWPKDGGRFITYGQVFTYDPRTGKRNIGIYRMHVFDKQTTGMHWQIQKGGGFHFYQAEKLGKEFEIAVALGTDPALLLATVAALPEGIDEAMFAGFLRNRRVPFTKGKTVSIAVPAEAEFVLEGVVPRNERKMEGPFGDHFGHYSAAAEFPVFRLTGMTHRKNPIYPAITVGKPPMEDKFLGDATQQMLAPLIRLIHTEVTGLWAWYEAGFHNLLVAAIDQRYQKEAMKAALGMMGTDQLSLTKCMITVSSGVDVRDWRAVLKEIREQFDPHYDFVMIPKVPLDTLDFTSYRMNLGSKMVIDATRKARASSPRDSGGARTPALGDLQSLDRRILDVHLVEETLLLVKTPFPGVHDGDPASGTGRQVLQKLIARPELSRLKMIAVVSEDVDIHEKESYIWGIFTRFDCERDVLFAETSMMGIAPLYRGVMGIDATWKPGYPEPLVMREEIIRRVDEKWAAIWK